MTAKKKHAYRYLLYHAIVRARNYGSQVRGAKSVLMGSAVESARRAALINEAVHNLAFYSAIEFERFDEDWFWQGMGHAFDEDELLELKSMWEDRMSRWRCEDEWPWSIREEENSAR